MLLALSIATLAVGVVCLVTSLLLLARVKGVTPMSREEIVASHHLGSGTSTHRVQARWFRGWAAGGKVEDEFSLVEYFRPQSSDKPLWRARSVALAGILLVVLSLPMMAVALELWFALLPAGFALFMMILTLARARKLAARKDS